jgi:hypothetical protein
MICVYCRAAIEGPPYKPCRRCGSPHHLNCWDEYGGCALPGCDGAPQAQSGPPAATPPAPAPLTQPAPVLAVSPPIESQPDPPHRPGAPGARGQRVKDPATSSTSQLPRGRRPSLRSGRRTLLVISVAVCLLLAGVAGRPLLENLLTDAPDAKQETAATDSVNPQYLADLVRKGPFAESLPAPLLPGDLEDVKIADPGATGKLDAVQLAVTLDPVAANSFPDLQTFAHMEVYPTRDDASQRGTTSLEDLRRRYGGDVDGTAQSFCIDGGSAGDFWTCAGVRDFVYAEVTISPAPNATLPIATGTVGAMLRYAERQTRLARA